MARRFPSQRKDLSMNLLGEDALQVILGSAVTADAHVSFEDDAGKTGRQNTNLTAAATVTVLSAAPGARDITEFNVHNKDVSGSTVVIQILNTTSSAVFVLWSGTLDAGQRVTWVEGVGFIPSVASTGKLDLMRYVTANSVHPTAATFAAITGLTPFPVVAGRVYAFECFLVSINDATTTGTQYAIGGVTATFITIGSISTVLNSATAATLSTGVATAVDTAAIVQTTGSTSNAPTWFAGTIQPSQTGDLSVKATSEVTVAAGLTVIKGSWAHFRETDN